MNKDKIDKFLSKIDAIQEKKHKEDKCNNKTHNGKHLAYGMITEIFAGIITGYLLSKIAIFITQCQGSVKQEQIFQFSFITIGALSGLYITIKKIITNNK